MEMEPLVNVKSKNYCAQLSSKNIEAEALSALKAGDVTRLTVIVSDVCPADDATKEQQAKIGANTALPEDHWINQPLEDEEDKTLLQLALEAQDDEKAQLTKILVSAGALVDCYNDDLDIAPIHVAVLRQSLAHVVALLECPGNMANVNVTQQPIGQSAVHFAAELDNVDILQALLDTGNADVNAKDNLGDQTPLCLAAKKSNRKAAQLLIANGANLGDKEKNAIKQHLADLDPFSVKVVQQANRQTNTLEYLNEVLEKRDLSVFKSVLSFLAIGKVSKDSVKGMTVFQRCCAFGLEQFAKILLKAGVDPNVTTTETKVAPVLLAASRAHQGVLELLKNTSAEVDPNVTTTETTVAPVLLAAPRRANQGVFTRANSKMKPTHFGVWTPDSQETVLHMILKRSQSRQMEGKVATDEERKQEDAKYAGCLQVLLQGPLNTTSSFATQMRLVINKKDTMDNTPLHYATHFWSQDVVRQILNLGANIGVRNWRHEIPLSRIQPDTLEDFLNTECLEPANWQKGQMADEMEVTFKFSFLAPPVSEEKLAKWDAEQQTQLEREAMPETDCIWYLSQSPAHRHLVNHPVITAFLWLKWQRIRRFFNRNIRFYGLFTFCLTWYIFARYGGFNWNSRTFNNSTQQTGPAFCEEISYHEVGQRTGAWYWLFVAQCVVQICLVLRDLRRDWTCCGLTGSEGKKCNAGIVGCTGWIECLLLGLLALVLWGSAGILWPVLTVLFVLMTIRELFQMASSLKRYVMNLENILEMALLSLVCIILYIPDHYFSSLSYACEAKRIMAAVAILLSWAEFITMIGRHPRLDRYNVYVTMFYKVMETFFYFLLWYSFFIIAFGLGFYIMLHNDVTANVVESEYVYFDSPWLALVKTATMFVGEIEFSDIPIGSPHGRPSYTTTSGYLFLLAFVFLIVVVLMNLLNGLAVSDTGEIKREAETVTHISRAETISYAECVLLGDSFDFFAAYGQPGSWMAKHLPRCALFHGLFAVFPFMKTIAQKITGATGILLFFTYFTEKQVTLPLKRQHKGGNQVSCCSCCCHSSTSPLKSTHYKGMDSDLGGFGKILASARRLILERRQHDQIEKRVDEPSLKEFLDCQKQMQESLSILKNELAAIASDVKDLKRERL